MINPGYFNNPDFFVYLCKRYKMRIRIKNPIYGVPITFLDRYNPTQFRIVGSADADITPKNWKGMTKEFVKLYYEQGNTGSYKEGNRLCSLIDNGIAKVPYKRILIQKIYIFCMKIRA